MDVADPRRGAGNLFEQFKVAAEVRKAREAVIALVKENHPVSLSGTAIGFVNSMITGAGALFQPLVGLLLDLAWTGSFAQGTRVYDSATYRLALASLLACCLAGLLCLLAVRETFCRTVGEAEADSHGAKPVRTS